MRGRLVRWKLFANKSERSCYFEFNPGFLPQSLKNFALKSPGNAVDIFKYAVSHPSPVFHILKSSKSIRILDPGGLSIVQEHCVWKLNFISPDQIDWEYDDKAEIAPEGQILGGNVDFSAPLDCHGPIWN